MEREKCIYIIFISFMNALVFRKIPCLCLMNRFNPLKDAKQFDALTSNQKKEKEKKRKKKRIIDVS